MQNKACLLTRRAMPSYETISNVWGDPKDRGSIKLNGVDFDCPMSSERVLRRMRYPDRCRILWVNAICINQADILERSDQVAMMDQIYTNTFRNLIWLGEADESSGRALDAIDAVLEDAQCETGDFSRLYDTLYNDRGVDQFASTGLSFDVDHTALLTFYARAWFRRLWVVQEAVLSPRSLCYCGDFEIPLLDVLRTASWLYQKSHFIPSSLRCSSELFRAFKTHTYADNEQGRFGHRSNGGAGLWVLLASLRDFEVYDPLDHVYGILGLYRKYHPTGELSVLLAPDYTKSLQDVLRDATRLAIEELQDLEYLNDLSHRPWQFEEDRAFPTWVSRCDRAWDGEHDPGQLQSMSRADGSAWRESFIVSDHANPRNVYRLQGLVVGIAKNVFPLFKWGQSLETRLKIFRNIEIDMGNDHEGGGREALAATLVAATNHSRRPASAQLTEEGYIAWQEHLRKTCKFPPILRSGDSTLSDPTVLKAAEYGQAFVNVSVSRRCFITSTELLGLGP